MPATDPQGYAGATGEVNAHYLSTFGTAALMSLLTAGQAIGSIVTFGNGQVSPYGGGIYQTNHWTRWAASARPTRHRRWGRWGPGCCSAASTGPGR